MLVVDVPVVPVPLKKPDPDVALDVQTALEQVYRSVRYDLRIDYRLPPLPDLSPDDAAWLDELLSARGLRPRGAVRRRTVYAC